MTRKPTLIGAFLSLLWLAAVAAFFTAVPDSADGVPLSRAELLTLALAVVLPLVLIWCVALAAQVLTGFRAETAALHQWIQQQSAPGGSASPARADPVLYSQLTEIALLTRQTDSRVSELAEKALAGQSKPMGDGAALPETASPGDAVAQPALPLTGSRDAPALPITVAEFIRALNFPRTADDTDGFRVMRRALTEPRLTKLLTVTQSLLSTLSEDGIYMDDLQPDLPMARVWRRFAKGERGITISALAGIRDRSAISLTKVRMRTDPVFRDEAHNFLREFDKVLRHFEQNADDDELMAMSDTRSSRAFMLIGRIAGTFD